MKTNKLMTAVALSAMFAACTQDAELNETLAKNDFSNIPMVEAEFSANTGVDSRMANGWGWAVDDVIGFAWGGLEDSFNGQAWANYPLYCTQAGNPASFDGQSMYYVGEYFAYLPYNTSLKNVGFVPFSIKNQTLSTSKADYAKYAISISPALVTLSADENEVKEGNALEAGTKKNYPLTLDRLSNLAKIDLSFKNASGLADLKVKKIALELNGGLLPLEFKFNSWGYKNLTNPVKSWSKLDAGTFFTQFGLNWATEGKWGKLELENKDGLAVANNALTTYAVVLPVAATDAKNLNVIVETNYGKVTVENVKVIAAGEGADKAATVSDKTALFTTFGTSGTIVAEVDMKYAEGIDAEAKDQAELETIIANWIAMGHANDPLGVTLKPESENDDKTFELTNFAIPEEYKGTLTLAIGGNASNGIVFNGETTIDKNITVMAPSLVKGTMTVEEGATWWNGNVEALLTIGNGGKLINNGVLNTYVKTAAATDDEVAGKYVHNGEKANVTVAIDNQGEAQWMAGASTAPGVKYLDLTKNNRVYAEVLSYEDIDAAAKAKVGEIRLVDGAYISNNTENGEIANRQNIVSVKCYGDVKIYVSDSYNSSTPQNLWFAANESTLTVTKESYVLISSDNKLNNVFAGRTINVETDATLSVNNVIYNAEVNIKDGTVVTWNVTGLKGI